MFCAIYQWLVSRSLDMGRELPAFVSRHLHRCQTCREFHSASIALTAKLQRGAVEILQESKGGGKDVSALNEKILAALAREAENKMKTKTKIAVGKANPATDNFIKFPSRRHPSTVSTALSKVPVPVPLLAAAMLILVLAMAVILQQFFPITFTGSQNTVNILDNLNQLTFNMKVDEKSIDKLAGGMESPMQSEMAKLQKSIESGANFVLSCFDVNITPGAE